MPYASGYVIGVKMKLSRLDREELWEVAARAGMEIHSADIFNKQLVILLVDWGVTNEKLGVIEKLVDDVQRDFQFRGGWV